MHKLICLILSIIIISIAGAMIAVYEAGRHMKE